MALNGNNDKVLPIVAKLGYPLNGRSFTVTGAKVGQTVKIAEVDSVGTPTAWEPTDFPTGGTDVDFDGYATEEFVESKVEEAKLDIKEADLVIIAPVPITMGGHHASGFVAGAGSISKACRKAHDTGEKPVVYLQCSGGSPEGVFREFCEITHIFMEEAADPADTRVVLDFVYRHAGSLYACTLVSQGENNILDNRFTEFECTELQESGNVDLTGYATESWVKEGYQPKGNYLTEVPEGYAKTTDIPAKPEDIGAQPAGNYLTEIPSGYATEEFVEQSLARMKTGVLCVTADFSTMIASHSPAEILEAVNSGKGVYLCVFNTDGIAVLSLVGVSADTGEAVFCNTLYDGLVFGHRLGILQASVYADKSVTFANNGSVLSMCVPVAENTDVGKVLGVTEDGLEWSEPPEGGVLQVTVDPASRLASHSPAEILAAAKSGNTVQLYDPSENGAVVLPLFLATQNEAVFSATGYGGYDRGYYTRTYEAFVRSDRTVDFANEGFFDSRCVPDFEAEDAGKVLTVAENGLQWVEPPDKTEIVNSVLAALPVYAGEVEAV